MKDFMLETENKEGSMKRDIKMYKVEIIDGKEAIAKEWLNFLNENRGEHIKLLKNEKYIWNPIFF
jgi:hypothetical protein